VIKCFGLAWLGIVVTSVCLTFQQRVFCGFLSFFALCFYDVIDLQTPEKGKLRVEEKKTIIRQSEKVNRHSA